MWIEFRSELTKKDFVLVSINVNYVIATEKISVIFSLRFSQMKMSFSNGRLSTSFNPSTFKIMTHF